MKNLPTWAELARPNDDVASLVYVWRSDTAACEASLYQSVSDLKTFRRDFHYRYFSFPDIPPFFLRSSEERLAFVHFQAYEDSDHRSFIRSAEVSVLVPRGRRRQGFGLEALSMAEEMARQAGIHTLYASIRPENEVSKKLFLRAGYERAGLKKVVQDNLYGRDEVEVEVYFLSILSKPKDTGVFLIAEVGANWQVGTRAERHKMAANIMEEASRSGFNAVKFQTFRAGQVYAPSAGGSAYGGVHGAGERGHEAFSTLEMEYEEVPILAKMAKACELVFMSTPYSPEDFDAVDPHVTIHKVSSYEMAHRPLLLKVGGSQKPVFISTGASFSDEIAYTVRELKQAGCSDLTLLQCTAAYPATPPAMNLRAMRTLAYTFGLPVGLSDHSLDCVTAPIMAVAYGARVIEKHVTMKRSLPTPDSFFSIEPAEMRLFVEKVRLAEEMAGSGLKVVQADEEEAYLFAKRAVQAMCPIQEGEQLQAEKNVAILRPGMNRKGAHPALYESLCGRTVRRSIAAGEGVLPGDVL